MAEMGAILIVTAASVSLVIASLLTGGWRWPREFDQAIATCRLAIGLLPIVLAALILLLAAVLP